MHILPESINCCIDFHPDEILKLRPLPRALALSLGMLTGVVLATIGLRDPTRQLPSHAIARVNDTLIEHAQWQAAVDAVQADRKTALSSADKSRLLDRLIDEELLLQYAIGSQWLRTDAALRGALVDAVMQQHRADAQAQSPGDDELREFYSRNADYFRGQDQLRVSAWRFETLHAAHQASDDFSAGAAMPIPDALMPEQKLRRYLGHALSQLAAELSTGSISEPVQQGRGWYRVQLHERHTPPQSQFAEIRDQVLIEWRRREAEQRLQNLLRQLAKSQTVIRRRIEP